MWRQVHMCYSVYIERSEGNNLQESVLTFQYVDPQDQS